MKTFTKKYQVWERDGDTASFSFTEFETLQECIIAEKQGDWYITKGVSLVVAEEGELPTIKPPVPYGYFANPPTVKEVPELVDEEIDPEQAALAAAYGAGPIGNIT